MKKLFGWISISLLIFTVSCEYNDSDLWDSIDDLYSKISTIEKKIDGLNSDISDLKVLVNALQENVTVVKVDETESGYTIILSDNTVVEIDNTVYEDSGAPVVGVKLDEDGLYYWTITVDGNTDWLKNENGEKVRVDNEKPDPKLSVDAEGLWTISYDGGVTKEYILDADGNPVSAIDTGTAGSFFKSVTEDLENVYFVLLDGTVLTVPKTVDFYMIIRDLPAIAEFALAETREFEVESLGVTEVVTIAPYGWKSSYSDGLLKIIAPVSKDNADIEGEVAVMYYGESGRAGAVKVNVALKSDFTGLTDGDHFTINITEITGNSIEAQIVGKESSMSYYVYPFNPSRSDEECIEQMKKRYRVDVNDGPQYVDYFYEGTHDYRYSNLMSGESYDLGVIGVSYDLKAKTIEVLTPVMKVPFKTASSVNFNSVYRFDITNKSWYGVDVNVHPSDDQPYIFTVVSKEKFDSSYDDFAQDYIDNTYLYPYYNELVYDYIFEWSHFTFTGDNLFSLPGFIKRDPYYSSEDLYPLEPSTDYYAVAFGCDENGDFSSGKVSKKVFRTSPFVASENCTFEIEATANRQDLNIKVTPSDPNVTYVTFIDERNNYSDNFSSSLQYSAYDIYWRKQLLEEGQDMTSSSEFYKGEALYNVVNLKASTAYIVFAYGCDKDGNITTESEVIKIVTESGEF